MCGDLHKRCLGGALQSKRQRFSLRFFSYSVSVECHSAIIATHCTVVALAVVGNLVVVDIACIEMVALML